MKTRAEPTTKQGVNVALGRELARDEGREQAMWLASFGRPIHINTFGFQSQPRFILPFQEVVTHCGLRYISGASDERSVGQNGLREHASAFEDIPMCSPCMRGFATHRTDGTRAREATE